MSDLWGRLRLANGVTLLHHEAPPSRLAAVTVALPVTPDQVRVAPLLADLWRATPEVDRMSRLGARVEPLSTPDCVALQIESPQACFPQVCAILSELAVRLPPAAQLQRIRRACATRLAGARGRRERAADLLRACVFGPAHPYATGQDAQIGGALSCHVDALARHVEQLAATAPTISVCGPGDVAERTARTLSSSAFRLVARHPAPAPQRTAHDPGVRAGTVDGERAYYLLGTRGVALRAAEKYALHVAWAVLGGRDGLLDQVLRRQRSLTYTVAAYSREFARGGYCACVVSCADGAVAKVAETVVTVLSDVAAGRFDEHELDRARQRLTVAYHLAHQSCRDIATRACCQEVGMASVATVGCYPSRIAAVTGAEVHAVAGQLFDRDDLVEIILRPRWNMVNSGRADDVDTVKTTRVSRDAGRSDCS